MPILTILTRIRPRRCLRQYSRLTARIVVVQEAMAMMVITRMTGRMADMVTLAEISGVMAHLALVDMVVQAALPI